MNQLKTRIRLVNIQTNTVMITNEYGSVDEALNEQMKNHTGFNTASLYATEEDKYYAHLKLLPSK